MLSEASYSAALMAYTGSALCALLLMAWWLRRRWSTGWVLFLFLGGSALLLTPAYPEEGVDTLAPALVVATFQMLTDGVEAAQHALRPLLFMLGLALLLTLLLRFTVFRTRGPVDSRAGAETTADPASANS